MVYSPELGYDPEEWEECPEPDHFLAFTPFTRFWIGLVTVLFAFLFFWILELNKRGRGHQTKEELSTLVSKVEPWKPLEEVPADDELSAETRLEKASQEAEQKARPERRRSSKRELTHEEEMELLAWKAEVHRMEEERLRAFEEPIDDEEMQVPTDEIESGTQPEKELEETKAQEEAKKEAITVQQPITVPVARNEIEIPEEPIVPAMEEALKREPQEDQQKLVELVGAQTSELPPENLPISTSAIVAKSSEQTQKIAYDDDLLPADASARTTQQLHQQLQKARELQPLPLLLDVPKPKELSRLHAEFAPGATPPSTPPGGVPLAEKLPELAAHYRQMADELTRKLLTELDEMDPIGEAEAPALAAQLQSRHRGQIDGALEETGVSQEVRQELARQLETHVATVVSQEMRRRSSSSALLPKMAEEQAETSKFEERTAMVAEEQPENVPTGKKGSSSSEEGFVKIHTTAIVEEESVPTSGNLSPSIIANQGVNQSQPPMLLIEHRLTPSPQFLTTDEEEPDQTNIRVSLFSAGEGDGDGMSTTADEIEFLPSAGQSPMPSAQAPALAKTNAEIQFDREAPKDVSTVIVEKKQHVLDADETEQVLALLQEYDLNSAAKEEPHKDDEQERARQLSSGATSSVGTKISSNEGVISLPESAQRTPGGTSVPESPASAGFDFINYPTEIKSGENSPPIQIENVNVMIEQQFNKATDEPEKVQSTPPPTVFKKTEQTAVVEAAIQQRQGAKAEFTAVSSPNIPSTEKNKQMEQQQKRAEQFIQEALDYMEQTTEQPKLAISSKPGTPLTQHHQFVVEEEMLESEEGPLPKSKGTTPKQTPAAARKVTEDKTPKDKKTAGGSTGGDGTSKQIHTNEVFDKPDPLLLFDDADDRDVTYAPEIQSMEVPPDQLSQADSLNLVDEFSEHHEPPVAKQQKEKETHEGKEQKTKFPEEGEEEEDDDEEFKRNHRELTPQEEAELHREIDQLRRSASPRLPDQIHRRRPQKPQAPQFLRSYLQDDSTSSLDSTVTSLRLIHSFRQSSLLSAVGVSSTQEMLLKLTSLEALSEAMRKAGLESSNLIFGIDYTASNKYQGERSFYGRSLHSVADKSIENPYQQVIKIMGRTLAPFAGNENGIPVFGFGDSSTGDWSVFPLNGTHEGECSDLDDVLRVYNRVTPTVNLSGPTNFAPLIYRSMEICHRRKDYHILVIIADGQVTNERATRKAIVSACQYPLSIIVVGVGDGPWDMMRVFDESLPKRPWDNFHFVEFHALITEQREELTMQQNPELAFAVHSLLEIPDQYNTIRKLGMLLPTYYTRPQPHSPRSFSPKPQQPQKK